MSDQDKKKSKKERTLENRKRKLMQYVEDTRKEVNEQITGFIAKATLTSQQIELELRKLLDEHKKKTKERLNKHGDSILALEHKAEVDGAQIQKLMSDTGNLGAVIEKDKKDSNEGFKKAEAERLKLAQDLRMTENTLNYRIEEESFELKSQIRTLGFFVFVLACELLLFVVLS